MSSQSFFTFGDDGISFRSTEAARIRTIYAPLCGTDSSSIKSAITPYLSGDIKVDKFRYVTRPASTEDLRQDVRNVFVRVGDALYSLSRPGDNDEVTVGPLWHKLSRSFDAAGLKMEALNFVPVSGEAVELMRVTVTNTGSSDLTFTPTVSVPIFGRALANKHDHEHVTSLLHRTEQCSYGVVVTPPMSFNEEGHLPNQNSYFVLGTADDGQAPIGSFPTMDVFAGNSGTLSVPEAVVENRAPVLLPPEEIHGKEVVGALRFADATLSPGESRSYLILIGTAEAASEVEGIYQSFRTPAQFDAALAENQRYWTEKARSIEFTTGDADFNAWMQWVTIQPVLRRIFGCSFLPDHDYGKGGKGWRDLWQDLLSLILIEPASVRESLLNNFAGVRIDGSNATIIGTQPGEFIADRNAITRVWMDHGAWPLLTIALYIHQTGDFGILLEDSPYFRDPQQYRTFEKDRQWTPGYGNRLKDTKGRVYQGSVAEHLLVQTLVPFFNVGEHNISRLESADWNDGLDMAFGRGESVTFMAFYGGNLRLLAEILEDLMTRTGQDTITVARELAILLDSVGAKSCDYDSVEAKKDLLFKKYFAAVQPELSGDRVELSVKDVAADLRRKGQWVFNHIRRQELMTVETEGGTHRWFNGYYDNKGSRVEGQKDHRVWMTLTGQVFPLMSGLASPEEVRDVVASVNAFLKDPRLGGYRLNSDFGLPHYLDLGRAFGFAYGTKENGAFFSHMIVMYAYALYVRGFIREGYEVLSSIYNMAMDTGRSRIYPGVPEYFDSNGKGMYHYLTGSASWFVLTELTQVFGVRGDGGNLWLDPKLVAEQFDAWGQASVRCQFAGARITVIYHNSKRLDAGEYIIGDVRLNGSPAPATAHPAGGVVLAREYLARGGEVTLDVSCQSR